MTQLSIFDRPISPLPPGALLTETEERVLGVLKAHVGRENAIKALDIASAVNLGDDRPVREAIKSLTENHGLWIASSIRPPHGFYMIDDSREGFEYADNLFRRAVSILRRYSKIKKISAYQVAEQIKLEFQKGAEHE